MQELHATIDIDASPEQVWAVLTDLARWPAWNPFAPEASGDVAEGARLRVRLAPPGGRPITMKPRVTVVDQGRMLEWLGHLGFRGIFDGRHRFELAPTPTGTRLTQSETFSGVLARLPMRTLHGRTVAGFAAMNGALKARAEQAIASTA